MMTDLLKRYNYLIAEGIHSLSCLLPLTNLLKDVISREFINFSQSEAYEVLRYLLFGCGVEFSLNPYLLHYIGHPSFKDLPTDQKATVEKLKSDILTEMNGFMKKHRIDLKLRKSDLIAPSQAKYLKCALILINEALNHQLRKLDVNISLDSHLKKMNEDDFKILLEDLREERKQLEVDNLKYKATISGYQNEILALKEEIGSLKTLRCEIDVLIENALINCPDEIRCSNMTAEEKVKCWAYKTNEIASQNRARLQRLKNISTYLNVTQSTVNGTMRINSLNFKSISHLLSPETLQYSKNNNVNLFHNEDLDMNALLEVVLHSIPKDVLDEYNTKQILEKDIPTNRARDLLEKLSSSLRKYELLLENSNSLSDMKINQENIIEWFNAFFISIPELKYERNITEDKTLYCDPFILKKVREGFY